KAPTSSMPRQAANQALALTSFLYGPNAAYIEDLQARYQERPEALDADWRAFFETLGDAPVTRRPALQAVNGSGDGAVAEILADASPAGTAVGERLREEAHGRGFDLN